MAEAIVQDWLAEYESLQPSEMQSFASLHENNQEIAEAIYTIFNERLKYPELIHGICNQFLSFYRSNEDGLKKFPMQFVPVLIYVYLNSVAMGDKKGCRSVETLLICIYNSEITAEDGTPKVVSFRLPLLAHASIYHEEKNLPLTDLRRWEENCNREIKWGPFSQIESINAQSRMKVMTALLFSYNHHLSLTQKNTLLHLCRMASQIVNQGFTKPGHAHRTSYGSDPTNVLVPRPPPRIPLSSNFLVELVHAIYFAMFNGFGTIAIQTLEDIHNRGIFEMYSDVVLVTSAVKNSLHANPSGQPSDGPMGLSVALTPSTNAAPIVSKSMITNASFRTKKLPDDIPIQGDDPHLLQSQTQNQPPALSSITEESGGGGGETVQQPISSRNSIIRTSKEGIKAQAHKALIAGFKKSKDKDKDKEKEKEKDKEKDKDKDKDKEGKGALHRNGNINAEPKEVPKPPIRKDKQHVNRSSVIQVSQDSSTTVDSFDKSPGPNIKAGKHFDSSSSLSNITASSATTSTAEMVPMQTILTNGNFNNDSDMTNDSIDTTCDASDSLHSGNSIDLSKQRPILPVISAIGDQVQNSQL
ncbi:hyccin isoform X1 [Eupeodes corollae]|uniref:hyccin isoform X1 n=1 Tax=Eupeodes corollae TaxID=290404 RepID=UPI00249078CA|nr:hyccin isoform X1 [Eupeodes corollae]XP_055917941.1 hyccin isoform X1 [Eupeodes corollae]